MYYILVDKNTNEVISVRDKRVNHSENLITCEVERVPEKFDYLVANNVRIKTRIIKDGYADKDLLLNEEMSSQEDMATEVIDREESFFTCDLVAKFYDKIPNEQLQKIKEKSRSDKITGLIRIKYSIDEELAILRQRYTKPEKFEEYNLYAQKCVNSIPKEDK